MDQPAKSHILVPFDFSEEAKTALSQTYNLAKFTHTEISILFVMDESPQHKLFSKQKDILEDEQTLKKAEAMLAEVAAEATKASGVTVKPLISRGKVYEQVNKVAAEINAVFIMMGTSGGSMMRKFMGSNTFKVVQDAPCPVITIKGKNHRMGCKNILLPLDTTKETREKVAKAIEIARYFSAAIRVVSIVTTSDEFAITKLKRQLQQVHQYIVDSKVACTAEAIEADSVTDAVFKYATKVDADLILIMTQQEMDWTNFFVGSHAQQIINHSEIPVLSIRPMEREDKAVFTPY
jgi:nucleotide-binding universal stress UspA family protein